MVPKTPNSTKPSTSVTDPTDTVCGVCCGSQAEDAAVRNGAQWRRGMPVAIRGMNSVKIIGYSPQLLATKCDKSVLLTSADYSNLPNVQLVPTELQLTLSWHPTLPPPPILTMK